VIDVTLSDRPHNYLPYTVSDEEQKLYNGYTKDEMFLQSLNKKKQRPDPQARYCPICKFEGGEEIKCSFIGGELTCPNCGYKPVMPKGSVVKMNPPLLSEGEILSGNTFGETVQPMKRYRLTNLASNRSSRSIANRRNIMDTVHENNNVDPFEPDLGDVI
jgi:hypothetical protein